MEITDIMVSLKFRELWDYWLFLEIMENDYFWVMFVLSIASSPEKKEARDSTFSRQQGERRL